MQSVSPSIRFDIYCGDALLRSETRGERIIRIGTSAANQLRVEDEQASRLHAMIEVISEGEIYVRDLGSRTGTYVNGEKSEKTPLHRGDEIRIGATRIVVVPSGADEAPEAPAVARSEAAETAASIESTSGLPPAALAPRRSPWKLVVVTASLLAVLLLLVAIALR